VKRNGSIVDVTWLDEKKMWKATTCCGKIIEVKDVNILRFDPFDWDHPD